MKKRAAKAVLLFAEIAAIALAVLAAGVAFFYFSSQRGPVSVGFFQPSVEYAIERRLPEGYDAQIDAIHLVRRGGQVRLRIDGLSIWNESGEKTAGAASVDFLFEASDFLGRKIGPQTIVASGAKFRVVRDAERTVKIPATRGRGGKSLLAQAAHAFDIGIVRSAFVRAEMVNAEVTFFDVASGRSWVSKNATIVVKRSGTGVEGDLKGDLDLDGKAASMRANARYDEEDGVIDVSMAGEQFPIGDLLTMFYGARAAIIDAPVSGEAQIEMTRDGAVRSSHFAADVGEGLLRLGDATAPIKHISWETGFDPQENRFAVKRFDYDVAGNSGVLSGAVALEFGEDIRDPRRVVFDLAVDQARLSTNSLPEALDIDGAAFAGVYEIGARRFQVDDFSAQVLDVEFAGAASVIAPRRGEDGARPSPGVTAAVQVEGTLDPERLLRVWPLGLASGARDWIEARLDAASIANIDAEIDLPPGGVIAGEGLPDDALRVSFDASGAKARFVPKMTPITNASGKGVLHGNSFRLSVERGDVGSVKISEGEVDIPEFKPRWRPTYYRFVATGRSEDILSVLDEAPLNLLSKINLDPDQFAGDAIARIEIMRPNKRIAAPDEYEYRGKATFEKMTISGLTDGPELTNAKGTVDLQPRSLTVQANAAFSDNPIEIEWRQNFFARQDGPGYLSVSGVIDALAADNFGLSLRRYVRGPVMISARADGEIGSFDNAAIKADFSDSTLTFEGLGWRKPAGAPADGVIELNFTSGNFVIEKFSLTGGGAEIDGSAAFKGGLLAAASFPTFNLDGAADLTLTADRKASGELSVIATGRRLSLGPAIKAFLEAEGSKPGSSDNVWGAGLELTARVDELALRNGVVYRDASFDLWRNRDALQALQFSALDEAGTPLKATLEQTGADEGPERIIEARSSDLGMLLSGVFGLSSLERGEGSMSLSFGGASSSGLEGVIEARDLHVVNAPLLARIFAAGSLDGLSNLMSGEGIDLSYAYGRFDYRADKLALRDFRATGPSVGMTAEGEVSFVADGDIALQGAVAPVYQLNSALQSAPIIGEILVGKKGEGVLALSYSVSGERASPDVTVNPLSALTPGVFRQLFQPERPEIPEGAPVESAPEETPSPAE